MSIRDDMKKLKCDACGWDIGAKYTVDFVLIAESRNDEPALISQVDGRLCRDCRSILIQKTIDFMKGDLNAASSD